MLGLGLKAKIFCQGLSLGIGIELETYALLRDVPLSSTVL